MRCAPTKPRSRPCQPWSRVTLVTADACVWTCAHGSWFWLLTQKHAYPECRPCEVWAGCSPSPPTPPQAPRPQSPIPMWSPPSLPWPPGCPPGWPNTLSSLQRPHYAPATASAPTAADRQQQLEGIAVATLAAKNAKLHARISQLRRDPGAGAGSRGGGHLDHPSLASIVSTYAASALGLASGLCLLAMAHRLVQLRWAATRQRQDPDGSGIKSQPVNTIDAEDVDDDAEMVAEQEACVCDR